MEERSVMASTAGMPLVVLPKDILRIILKKIRLRDRLRLELLTSCSATVRRA